ncbi:MAG TPA: hypothetical protein VG317_20820, partial [Pseudonocardiaceae bacterium]|nr:hypothetical protein [Pseudonocardiaceae bacterium]
MAGYEVNSGLLSEAAKGINDTIAELKTLGIAEAADEGRGFSGLEMTGLTVGNQGLRSAFAGFCDR